MSAQDDDLYSGYDDGVSSQAASAFQPLEAAPPGTASMGPPGTAMRGGTASVRQGTASSGEQARPMTSNRGAGFSSAPRGKFDPLAGRGALGPAGASSLLPKKQEASPEEAARDLERLVHELMEASAELVASGEAATALEKALEARKKEGALRRWREQHKLDDSAAPERSFAVELAVAGAYGASGLHQEALDAYTALVKNKAVPNSARLRVNMGNIYFSQGKHAPAIKMYRMALDSLPGGANLPRARILRNIGAAFVRMGQYGDAAGAFEQVMERAPDHQAAFNLVVCCYALGDKEGMRSAFTRLMQVPGLEPEGEGEDEEEEPVLAAAAAAAGGGNGKWQSRVASDSLKDDLRRKQAYIKKCILDAAQLIADQVDKDFAAGFDWCAEALRVEGFPGLAAEVALAKAERFMRDKALEEAAGVLKEFERKESVVRARAATNLAFLNLLEGTPSALDAAAKYTDMALQADRYNAKAHVNRGVLLLEAGSLAAARQAFADALAIEPLCVQALYNLGVVHLRLQEPEAALGPLRKLHGLLPDQPEVLHCLALAHDMMGDSAGAIRWLEMLTSLVPHDPGVLCKLGAIYHRLEEEARSLSYYQEAHRAWPVNLDVISWLGAFHVRNEVYEKAIPYFDLAAAIQPQEAKWGLMVASCFRRIGAYQQALSRYAAVAAAHPSNLEALRYLVHLCQELGRPRDLERYTQALMRAERAQAAEAAATQGGLQVGDGDTNTSGGVSSSMQQQQGGGGYGYGQGAGQDGGAAGGGSSLLDSQLAARGARGRAAGTAGGGGKAAADAAADARRRGGGGGGGGDGGGGGGAAGDDWGQEQLGEDLLPM